MKKGPTIQSDIFTILTRFRTHKIALTADIEKMYRQVLVQKEDTDYQRIVWRSNPEDAIQHFRLQTVTYGTTPGSYLAIRSLQQVAKEYENEFPRTSKIICRDFYVDDLMSGGQSIEEVQELQTQLNTILQSGGFHLRKWSSNSKAIASEVIKLNINDDSTTSSKVLGIQWTPLIDFFSFEVCLAEDVVAVIRKPLNCSIHWDGCHQQQWF